MTALHAAGGGLPLALHIPHVVEQAGSVAGFAAVIGLAVLSALYFSQARDLRRLREWAGRAPERAAEGQPGAVVPGRVVAVPQQQQQPAKPVVGPAPAPGNGAPADAPKADEKPAEDATAATNGDAAPSVTTPDAEGEESKDAKPADGTPAKPGMPAPASAAAAAAGAGAKSVSAPGPGDAAKEGAAPASTPGTPASGAPAAGGAAAGAAAAVGSASAPPKPGTPPAPGTPGAAPAGPSGPRTGAQPQRPPGSVLPPRTGTLPPVRRLPTSNVGTGAPQGGILGTQPEKKKRNPLYVVLAIAGVLVLGAAAAIGVPAIVNGTKDNDSPKTASKKTKTSAKKAATPVDPTKITVAVLNGTSIPGLAAQVADRVEAEGFTVGTISNASQTQANRANSVAMYSSGHRSDANTVARKLSIRDVQRIDANSQGIAGDASVVVIVGSDKTQ